MKRKSTLIIILIAAVICSFSFRPQETAELYCTTYHQDIQSFRGALQTLVQAIEDRDLGSEESIQQIQQYIALARIEMKGADFWMRYLEPLAYKKINGPLPVEWETEVFEKYEKPYKRECAGLTLAALYLEEEHPQKDSLLTLVRASLQATEVFAADSITGHLSSYHHFFLCNRLYLLNLAAIYTTGFECPNTDLVVPELRSMMAGVYETYQVFNSSFAQTPLSQEYMALYKKAIGFVNEQPDDHTLFDHFSFIRDYINPLYLLNQKMINQYKVVSHSLADYSLTKNEVSIFSKTLYNGQDPRGIFHRVEDEAALKEIDSLGKLLFYDPILSGNNMRSCASCHKPTEYFTDTLMTTAFQFDHTSLLPRNTPSLLNSSYNHLLMADGKHYTLQGQAKDVISNPVEMGCDEDEMLRKVLSCATYKKGFSRLLKYTPTEPKITKSISLRPHFLLFQIQQIQCTV